MSKRMTRRRSILVAAVLAGHAVFAPIASAKTPLQRVEIDTSTGKHTYSVEVMRTPADREHGLMDRKSMPHDHGMLFDFGTEQPVVFWMKNTFIPLDMIFVGADGHVVGIKHDAKPMDETLIPSGAPTLGVIELNAGVAQEIDLKVGDEVRAPMFHPTKSTP